PHRLRKLRLHLFEHLEPGHLRHALIGEQDAHLVRSHELEPPRRRRRRENRKAFGARRLEDCEVLGLVVDEENVTVGHGVASSKFGSPGSLARVSRMARGTRTETSVPAPTRLDTPIVPPSAVTTRRTIVSPSPIPRPTSLVV